VLGRTGDSRVRRALFGSLPAHMVQVAPVPVTVVP
jgi:nucleotide-binding universal stress UspA family protein